MAQSTSSVTVHSGESQTLFLDRCPPNRCLSHRSGCIWPWPTYSTPSQANQRLVSGRRSISRRAVKCEAEKEDPHVSAENWFDSLNMNVLQNTTVSLPDSKVTTSCRACSPPSNRQQVIHRSSFHPTLPLMATALAQSIPILRTTTLPT